jgi:RNA polymerase sigma factor (sigma-70 family)
VHEAQSVGRLGSELDVLTDREREVLELLTEGKTNKEIAEALVISTNTVKRHIKSIFSKLDIHTRSAAAAKMAAH